MAFFRSGEVYPLLQQLGCGRGVPPCCSSSGGGVYPLPLLHQGFVAPRIYPPETTNPCAKHQSNMSSCALALAGSNGEGGKPLSLQYFAQASGGFNPRCSSSSHGSAEGGSTPPLQQQLPFSR